MSTPESVARGRAVRVLALLTLALGMLTGLPSVAAEPAGEPLPSASLRSTMAPAQAEAAKLEEAIAGLQAKLETVNAELAAANAEFPQVKQAAGEAEAAALDAAAGEPPPARNAMQRAWDSVTDLFAKDTPADTLEKLAKRIQALEQKQIDLNERIAAKSGELEAVQVKLGKVQAQADYVDARVLANRASESIRMHREAYETAKVAYDQQRAEVDRLTEAKTNLDEDPGARAEEREAARQALRAAESRTVELYKQVDHHKYQSDRLVPVAEQYRMQEDRAWQRTQQLGVGLTSAEVDAIAAASEKAQQGNRFQTQVLWPVKRGLTRVGHAILSPFRK